MESDPARRLVSKALSGDEPALADLVDLLTPVIQARAARSLLAHRPSGESRNVRQQVEDLTQEVFLVLFADDGRVLRSWQPERGLSLLNFVGLVAARRTISTLRTDKRNPWKEIPIDSDELDGPGSEASPEGRAASRQQLELVLQRLREQLSPLGWHLFDLLLIQELSIAEVERRTAMSRDAIYAWRSRLRRRARQLLREILSETT